MSSYAAHVMFQIRDQSGLTQRELAAVAGTSAPTIAAYESGTKEPRLSTLERIAEAVDLRIHVEVDATERGARIRARKRAQMRELALASAGDSEQERADALAASDALAKALGLTDEN